MLTFDRKIQQELLATANSYPVVTLIGPRQSGKTTLARSTFPDKAYVNLELPDVRQFAQTDPRRFFEQLPNGAILDEVQRTPELLSYIQGIVDEQESNGLFILTGSHQLSLQKQISQSLAGRTGLLHLLPLSLDELKTAQQHFSVDDQIFYGGYPRIYKHNITPQRFFRDYVQTYLERDVKEIINVKSLDQFQRFLQLCAARIGQLIDYTSLANDLGVSRHTIKEWLSILKASFIITKLPPYYENLGKRIIKSSKLYFTDLGLVSYLLGIQNAGQITQHPLRGALFENLVLIELMKLKFNNGIEPKFYFYRDSEKNEVDIIYQDGPTLIAIEIKSGQSFHKEFLKGLQKFKKLANQYNTKSYLIYSGLQEQMLNECQVLNYMKVGDYFSSEE